MDQEPGVPPLSVLTKMFPKVDAESELKYLTLSEYESLLNDAKIRVVEREIALNESATLRGVTTTTTTTTTTSTTTTTTTTTSSGEFRKMILASSNRI